MHNKFSENLPLNAKIRRLKQDRSAILLAHNYQLGEVQDIADFVGDSLELARRAAETDADTIVFCGVHFMAETAAILSPDKTVLLPDMNAGCPMANMLTADQLKAEKAKHPEATVVTYVNSSAAVKAESDWCCTSANALKVVEAAEGDTILFVPDKYLGAYVASKTHKRFILWNGYCPTHVKIRPEDVARQRAMHPEAVVMVHPECVPEVSVSADQVFSTGGMVRFAGESDAREFIVGTEVGMLHRLEKENPGKRFYPASELAVCPNMKLTSLEKVLWALEEMEPRMIVPKTIADKARAAIDRMLTVV